ncbi:ribosomal RNA-processing protein 7 homolog A [Pieris rapae]|uniref:ribosomal RNA-processing protein 7 homolog A n=1 Tax=Pieris rapae TaxID=64459 RepID=UPI001E27BE68|nr:ribosomal RNA-processing protein 7 homolog A [Pieris rapae]
MKTQVSFDFKALQLKINDGSTNPHMIYIKEHLVRDHTADKPSGRTLFIVNVPPYVDELGITDAFKEAGTIQSVHLSEKPNAIISNTDKFIVGSCKPSFRVCYLVFKKVAYLQNALKLKELQPMNLNANIFLGIKKFIHEYNESVLKPMELKNRIEIFMKRCDEKNRKEIDKEKQLEQEDDEGWITVTKRSKIQSFARTEKVEHKIMAKENKSKKKKELTNFYSFQIRESKMKHIVSLRQKFDEDKKKIAQIKQSRRFKPF